MIQTVTKLLSTYCENVNNPDKFKIIGEAAKDIRRKKNIPIENLVSNGLIREKIRDFEGGTWPRDEIFDYQGFLIAYCCAVDELAAKAEKEKMAAAQEDDGYDCFY